MPFRYLEAIFPGCACCIKHDFCNGLSEYSSFLSYFLSFLNFYIASSYATDFVIYYQDTLKIFIEIVKYSIRISLLNAKISLISEKTYTLFNNSFRRNILMSSTFCYLGFQMHRIPWIWMDILITVFLL